MIRKKVMYRVIACIIAYTHRISCQSILIQQFLDTDPFLCRLCHMF